MCFLYFIPDMRFPRALQKNDKQSKIILNKKEFSRHPAFSCAGRFSKLLFEDDVVIVVVVMTELCDDDDEDDDDATEEGVLWHKYTSKISLGP